MSSTKRNACYADFLKGMSLRSIATKHELSSRTLERWSIAEHWVIRRNRVWDEEKLKIAQQHVTLKARSDVIASEAVYDLMKLAHADLSAYRAGLIPKKALKFTSRDLINFCKSLHFANYADRFNALSVEIKHDIENKAFDPERYSAKLNE